MPLDAHESGRRVPIRDMVTTQGTVRRDGGGAAATGLRTDGVTVW